MKVTVNHTLQEISAKTTTHHKEYIQLSPCNQDQVQEERDHEEMTHIQQVHITKHKYILYFHLQVHFVAMRGMCYIYIFQNEYY